METIYFGTFAPLHRGHLSDIMHGKKVYEHIHIIVSGYVGDRGDKFGINLHQRYETIKNIFEKDELVSVYKLDESLIEKYPNGWDSWLKMIEKLVPNSQKKIFICGEEDYKIELEKRGYKVKFVDRRKISISGTQIRNNPYEYWNYMSNYFHKFFTKKVLLFGTASTGKTTLTKDLATYFNTTYIQEYARTYQTDNKIDDEELSMKDFLNIGIGQYEQTKNMLENPATNKIFFADTDILTTSTYLEIYKKEDEIFLEVERIFSDLINKEQWDLILFLQPDTKYIDDGFRDMNYSDEKNRKKLNELFEKKLIKYNKNFVKIDGSFREKFEKSVELCQKLLDAKKK